MKRRPVLSSTQETPKGVQATVEKFDPVETDGTLVKYMAGMTVSGKYQSVIVHFGLDLPTTVNNVDEAFEQAVETVDKLCADKHKESKLILRTLVKEHEAKYGK